MSGWHTGPMVAVDTETSGTDRNEARIVTVSLVHINPGQPVDTDHHLIAVDVDIPKQATDVHGITTDRARAEGRPAADVLGEVLDVLEVTLTAGTPLVLMNAAFDLTILDREARRWGVAPLGERLPVAPVVDVRVLDKQVDRYRKGSRTLTALCDTYKVRLDGAHDAAADALAAARVAWRIGQQHPTIAAMDLADLHKAQTAWHAEQVRSFAAYRARTGKPLDDVDESWPVSPQAALPLGEAS